MINETMDIPSQAQLLGLVKADQINAENSRYAGDAATISMDMLDKGDAARLQSMYKLLQAVYSYLHEHSQVADHGFSDFPDFLREQKTNSVLNTFRHFGSSLKEQSTNPAIRKTLHDVRGGSLVALFFHLELFDVGEAVADDCSRIYILARDHLKIMRNAVFDLDPAGYANDLQPMEHNISLLKEKWADTDYKLSNNIVQVLMTCDFCGSVSERCMEFAALDRVIYNLINNASRFTSDHRVYLRIFPLDKHSQTQLRFVVHNRITPEHRQILTEKFGDNTGELFKSGFTTGGHGIGMRICADFVVHGYGLNAVKEAIDGGYLGVKLIDDHFVAWFHWPARYI